jgi:hypothetical protein
MQKLIPGIESEKRVELLLELTDITSSGIKSAMVNHLTLGHPVETSALLSKVEPSNVSRGLASLNEVAEIVEKIKEHDWNKIKYHLSDMDTHWMLMFQLTKLTSEKVKLAAIYHLASGISISEAARMHDVKQPNVSRAISAVKKVSDKVEQIKEHDWTMIKYHAGDIYK